MVNLLLLIANVYASDVYELCMTKKQLWSDRYQQFQTINTTPYYGFENVQFIIHERSVEINRDKRNIISKFEQDGMDCWREHENSFFCYDEPNNQFLWEFNKRNGDVTRDLLFVCVKNGEPID